MLGNIYLNGYGIKQNYALALKYYKLSADSSNPSGYIGLGVIYQCGSGLPEDLNKARFYYQKAYELG